MMSYNTERLDIIESFIHTMEVRRLTYIEQLVLARNLRELKKELIKLEIKENEQS